MHNRSQNSNLQVTDIKQTKNSPSSEFFLTIVNFGEGLAFYFTNLGSNKAVCHPCPKICWFMSD